MSKKVLAVFLSVIMTVMLILSPYLEVSDEHRKSCCGCDCLICLIASTVCLLSDYISCALLCIIALSAAIGISRIAADRLDCRKLRTPITLKTEILS